MKERSDAVRDLKNVQRIAMRFSHFPDRRLHISDDDMADAFYVDECLYIMEHMSGVKSVGSAIYEGRKERAFRLCMRKISKRARRVINALDHGAGAEKIHDIWDSADCAASFMHRLSGCGK